MRRGVTVLAIGAILAACGGTYSQTTTTSPETAAQQTTAPDTMRATVQQVNAQAGWLDCLGGIGFALEVTRIHVVDSTRIMEAGAPTSLASLRPGDIVFVAYRLTARGDVASEVRKIGRLGSEEGGGI